MPTFLHPKLAHKPFYIICFFSVFLLLNCSKTIEISPDAEIISFEFKGISPQTVQISSTLKTLEVTVPYNTSVKSLIPNIQFSNKSSIVPASGIPQDFSQPVYYVLTNETGNKVVYKVIVTALKQPNPEINNFDKTVIEAGDNFIVKGKYFGNNQGSIQGWVVNAKNEETQITSRLIDSTQIQINTPKTLSPTQYSLKINVNGKVVVSNLKIDIQYPSPELLSVGKNNILQGDTLFIKGNFIEGGYQYKLQLLDAKNVYPHPIEKTTKGLFYAILSKNTPSNVYSIGILNESTKKTSQPIDFKVHLYDFNQPFVTGILNKQSNYKAGDKVIFKTYNFERFPARFFQVQLSNGKDVLFQNGIYNKTTNTLTLDLPTTLQAGNYNIAITLINTTNQEYAIEMDEILVVK